MNSFDVMALSPRMAARNAGATTTKGTDELAKGETERESEPRAVSPTFLDLLAVLANMPEKNQLLDKHHTTALELANANSEENVVSDLVQDRSREDIGILLRAVQHSRVSNDSSNTTEDGSTSTAQHVQSLRHRGDAGFAVNTQEVHQDAHHGRTENGSSRRRSTDTDTANVLGKLGSIEQLMALGDANGAARRAALDSLLAHAGTPTGIRLSAHADAIKSMSSELSVSEEADPSSFAIPSSIASALASMIETSNGTASASLVDTPQRAVEGLSPELRGRLQRVINRMRNEYGHDVTVVETVRSQERQDWLFEQGRSRPGSVVTWTHESAHTRGDAVDVLVDGKWDNASGYARLQRIAREEGLRTLGMKDPGHLELVRSTTVGQQTENGNNTATRNSDPVRIAGVARVAGIAGVAGIANSANTGASAQARTMSVSQSGAAPAGVASAQQGGSHHNSMTDNPSQQRGSRQNSLQSGNSIGWKEKSGIGGHSYSGDTHDGGQSGHTAVGVSGANSLSMSGTTPATESVVTSSSQAERIAEIQQMRTDAPATPVTRMTLNVGQDSGAMEKITIDLRGNTVSTRITADEGTAGQLRMHTAELQDALGRHGLEGDSIRISSLRQSGVDAGRSSGGVPDIDGLRFLTGNGAGQGTASENSGRERPQDRNWNQEQARRDPASQTREDQARQEGRNNRSERFTGKDT